MVHGIQIDRLRLMISPQIIGFEKYALSPEISGKMCKILLVWIGRPILDTFLVISWDSVLISVHASRFKYNETYNLNNFFHL